MFRRDRAVVEEQVFNPDWSRPVDGHHSFWIDCGQAGDGCEPQTAILALPRGRTGAVIAFARSQPVDCAVDDAVYEFHAAVGKIVQFLFADTEDSVVAPHPEIPEIVLENGSHGGIEQALLDCIGRQAAVLDPVETARCRTHPGDSVRIDVNSHHVDIEESFLLGVDREMAVLKPADAITVSGDPEGAIRRLRQPYDSSGTGGMLKSTVLEAGHPGAMRADPEVSRMDRKSVG